MKTEQEIKDIALGIHKGEIYTDRHIRSSQELAMVFMPLMFFKDEEHEKILNGDIGMVYEYMNKAGGRSINGHPSFMSMCTLTKAESEQVIGYVVKYREAEQLVTGS